VPRNLGVLWAAHRADDRVVIIDLLDPDRPREVRYPEFEAACNAVAHAFTAAGLGVGDRFGLLSDNRLEYLEIFYGAMRAGIVPVPINGRVPKETVEWVVADSGCRLVFVDDAHRELCPDGARVIGIDGAGERSYAAFRQPHEDKGSFPVWDPPDDAVCFQPYTSGSTGRPKGVLLLHRAHVWVSKTISEVRDITTADRMVVAAPFYHKNAMNAVKSMLWAGGSMVILPRFGARGFLNVIGRYGITILSGVPTIYALMLQEQDLVKRTDLSSVRLITMGGAPASDPLIDAVAEAFPGAEIVQIYGITETGAALFGPHPEREPRPRHSLGWPIPGNAFRFIDGPSADEGMLLVKSPGMMLGYHNNPGETAKRLQDGWYHTGDVLRRDADGWFYFLDRADDMFVSAGNNIFPGEVEDMLERHPDIHQAAVVAVPDPVKHRLPVAFIVLREGARLSEDAVKKYALANAPAYQHPRRVIFVDALPLTGAGKIDRKSLTARAGELAAGGTA